MNLRPADLAMFEKFRIPLELVEQAAIERVSNHDARETYGIKGGGDMAGVAFPYFNPEAMANGRRRHYVRIRRDHPEIEDGREKKKYVAPYGDRKHFYFPPCPELFADPSIPIVLLESEKAALALLAWSRRVGRQLLPLAMGGCWGWKGKVGIQETASGDRVPEHGPILDLNICRDGRLTYVLLDANCAINRDVEIARRELVRQLRRQKAEVHVLDLPYSRDINGPDDYLAVKGDEALTVVFDGSAGNADSAPIRVDMPETVLDGRLGELCQRRLASFPLAYSWGALVIAAGVLISRTQGPLRTNLFWCPVGPKASGKSQSMEMGWRLLGMWPQHSNLIYGKFGSAEGLIKHLKEIEQNAVRLFAVDELGHLLAKAAIDRSSFPFIMNSLYYHDQQTGGTGKEQFQFDCRLSIAGGLVEELFGDSFGLATTGGLYDRFLFGLCPQPYEFLYRPFEGPAEKLNPFAAAVDPEVWQARDQWVKDGISPRVAEHALRVAYICASVDGRPSLRALDLGPAHALAEYQMRARIILQPNPGENPDARCAVAIRGWLNSHAMDAKWIKRRDLIAVFIPTAMAPASSTAA